MLCWGMTNNARPRRVRKADDPRIAEVMGALRQIVHALYRSSRSAERAHGISGAQLFVLQLLAESPAPSVNALAERTLTHQSSVSVVVSRLVERGLVARQRSAEDGRRVELCLTPAGEEVLQRTPAAVQLQLLESLRSLAAEELDCLSTVLSRISSEMGVSGGPVQFFFQDGTA